MVGGGVLLGYITGGSFEVGLLNFREGSTKSRKTEPFEGDEESRHNLKERKTL